MKRILTYEGYDQILDRVRGIIERHATSPEQYDTLIQQIDALESDIENMLEGRNNYSED
jgi:hypothetical protein|tara:strand:- start:302 stop:478 length:177 start_codon:yes stop_codon:yes gene_type:complete